MVFQIVLYTFVTIVLLVITIIYFKLIRPEKQIYDAFRAQGVDGVPFVPLIGQLPQLRQYRKMDKAIMEYLQSLCQKYGNVFLFSFGPLTRLIVNEPDLLADVLSRNNAQNYIKPSIFKSIFIPIVGSHNLLVAEGSEHERARRMINPAFHHVSLKSMVSIISDQTAKAIDGLLSKYNSDQQKQEPVDLQAEFNALTLSIIASSAFGSGYETVAHAKDIICQIFTETLDAVAYRSTIMVNQIPFLSQLPFWKKDVVDSGARVCGKLIDQIITDRRQGRSSSLSSGPDLLDLLLSAVDDEGQSFSDQEIKEEALTFVAAGSETTGNLMVWMYYVLMTQNDVLQACREEVDRILPDGIEPTNEHLSELVVCEAVINEALRLYPPAAVFVRECIHEHTIGTERQLRIPKGTAIIINNYMLHRRSDLWPRPLEFDYTRWMRDPKTGLKPKLPHPFAYLPFAAGPRNCIGQNFALLEAKIMLAMFVQRCNFEMTPGQKIVPELKITMRTKYGLWAKITKRHV
jgi:cytochrome P450